MPLVQIKNKSQVTLPKKIREALGLETGDYLEAELQDNIITLKPVESIDKEDAWFWSKEWQEGERRADEDLKAGRYTEHDSVDDSIKNLRSLRNKK